MHSLEAKLLAACRAVAGRCSERTHHQVWCFAQQTNELLSESSQPPRAAPLSLLGYSVSQYGIRSHDRRGFGLRATFSSALPSPEVLMENSRRECLFRRPTPLS